MRYGAKRKNRRAGRAERGMFLAPSPNSIFVFALYPAWETIHRQVFMIQEDFHYKRMLQKSLVSMVWKLEDKVLTFDLAQFLMEGNCIPPHMQAH